MLFRLWESINSYKYDERMLHFLSRLSEMHIDPSISDPRKIQDIPDDARSEGEGRPAWSREDIKIDGSWPGLFKDGTGVGVFTDHEVCKFWDDLMYH
jgi:proteasome activator subunit 4